MSLIGLGNHKKPFVYLDDFIPNVDWDKLHADVSYGISKSRWDKKFVSSGVHDDFKDYEITPYIRDIEWHDKHLSSYEKSLYRSLTVTDEKIKFINALKEVPHPFWVLFIRNNKRVEPSGVFNKAKAEDCHWTENSKNFPSLVSLIESMPFKDVGRVILFMTESNNKTLPHFDSRKQHDRPNDDFIWFTTKPSTKNIFVMDSETKEKIYSDTNKKFVWWNEMDYHGTDPVPHFSFSIRIDGVFNSNVRDAILS